MRPRLSPIALAAICLASPSVLHAQDNPLSPYLEVAGARTTLPVNSAKSPFSYDFATDVGKVRQVVQIGERTTTMELKELIIPSSAPSLDADE